MRHPPEFPIASPAEHGRASRCRGTREDAARAFSQRQRADLIVMVQLVSTMDQDWSLPTLCWRKEWSTHAGMPGATLNRGEAEVVGE